MDNDVIGEYLKRLRLRAGYTQADLGNYINVTDKAISRWESGVGMPEIGNLMVLAKLFGVTVDDILNCNEKVFENSGENNCTESEKKEARPCTSEREPKPKNVFKYPSRMFLAVLLFAYLAAGVYSAAAESPIDFSAIYIIFSALAVLAAVCEILSFKITETIYKTAIIAIYSAAIINCLVLTALQYIYVDGGEFKKISAFVSAALTLLLAMQLLYKLSESAKSEKNAESA